MFSNQVYNFAPFHVMSNFLPKFPFFPLILWHWSGIGVRRKLARCVRFIVYVISYPSLWCLLTAVPLSSRKKNKLNGSLETIAWEPKNKKWEPLNDCTNICLRKMKKLGGSVKRIRASNVFKEPKTIQSNWRSKHLNRSTKQYKKDLKMLP